MSFKRNLSVLLMSLLSVGLVSCASLTKSQNREVAQSAGSETSKEREVSRKLVSLTNAHRKRLGRSHLSGQSYLKALAKEHSEFLAKQHNSGGKITEYSHAGVQQRSFSARNRVKLTIGENVAWYWSPNDDVAERMFRELLKSRSHRQAIERKGWTNVGISTTQANDGTYFGVQLLGRPYVKQVMPGRTIFL